jgi:hypothetical protein
MVRRVLAAVAAGSVMLVAFLACVGDDPAATGGGLVEAGSDHPDLQDGNTSDDEDVVTSGDSSASDDGSGRGDGDASVDAPFDVRAVPNLRLWLEASMGITVDAGYVTSWTDSSGRWGDAGVDGSSEGGVHRATIKHGSNPNSPMPSWIDSDIGGRPVVKTWSGGDPSSGYYLGIPNHPDFAPGTGDWLMAGVVKLGQGNGAGQVWRLMTTSSDRYGIELTAGGVCVGHPSNPLGPQECTSPSMTLNPVESHVIVARRVGGALTYRVDGSLHGSFKLPDNPNLTVSVAESPLATIAQGQTLEIAELIDVVGATTDDVASTIESYLQQKYAIPHREE